MAAVGDLLADRLGRSSRSIQITSTRGVITLRTERSASRSTPLIMSRSATWKMPVRAPSAISRFTSSSVTWLSGRSGMRSSLTSALVESAEQQDDGRADERQSRHERRDRRGDPLRVVESDPLRHELADKQRQVGDADDDDSQGDRIGVAARGSGRIRLKRPAKRGAGIGAGEHADQRDARSARSTGSASGRRAASAPRARRAPSRPPSARAARGGTKAPPAPPWRRSRSGRIRKPMTRSCQKGIAR